MGNANQNQRRKMEPRPGGTPPPAGVGAGAGAYGSTTTPPPTSAFMSGQQQQQRTHEPGVSIGTAPAPRQAPAMHVRCPTCARTLIAPDAPQFACPCGQLLQRPPGLGGVGTYQQPYPQQQQQQPQRQAPPPPQQQQQPRSSAQVQFQQPPPQGQRGPMLGSAPPPVRVRCPRCRTVLEPPPGARLFACPQCSLHLTAPPPSNAAQTSFRGPAQNQPSQQPSAPPSSGFNAASAGATGATGTLQVSTAMEALLQKTSTNMGSWRRRAIDDHRMGWRRQWTEEEEAGVMEAERIVLDGASSAEALEGMSDEDIARRLAGLGITAGPGRDDLVKKTVDAVSILSRRPVAELNAKLDAYGLDFSVCQNTEDLAARLFAYVWSGGTTTRAAQASDGFVRFFSVTANRLEWIPAMSYELPVEVPGLPEPLSAPLLLTVSTQTFRAKCAWFRVQLDALRVPWDQGRVQMRIRRSHLLEDSFNNFLKLSPEDMRRFFRFEFLHEPGVDAGGVAREWFNLVTDLCFNVDFGLFEYGGVDNVCYQISPVSGYANELHLKYFRFLGRLLGKALFDGQQIGPHLTRVVYKHMLGWPITEDDVEFVDAQVAKSIKDIRECDDVSVLCLTMTTMVSVFGEMQEVELVPGGANIDVTNDNRDEYLRLLMKHIMLNRVSEQTHEFLAGIYEVVPVQILSVFDFNELELLMCGLPNIDVEDWKTNTRYRGDYAAAGHNHPTIKMFWEVMAEYNDEERARFLQFATGTSRVPVQGFAALQGNDGNIRNFCIESVPMSVTVLPRAHTCFNRIELPPYPTKSELKWRLNQALSMELTGFAIE